MKIYVYLKDPDGFSESVRLAVEDSLESVEFDEDEKESLQELREEKAKAVMGAWVEYGEYVGIEFDTEKKTARVVPLSERKG